ncbi:aminotransferase class V-fold PLP-dependent enzyme [Kutzneria sp. CA-103260]|uniref:aminotransferase class V-fold PLP-dependent enzyme n=1 Tax=Kutzneria sp. CA-103260 TaxID=2802641 RepID=UPI001BA79A7C|nr:hypothetical protein [Kutzneria sp. CA-103260]QUQ65392.1 D-glucosaminate-6-phosphate ammonia lyase [Kutzneria sp. CA-103260]
MIELRPVINAAATLTRLGGSRLAPPVIEAMTAASQCFVDLPDLQRQVGAELARLTGNEAGYVSSGASAGITLSVAACAGGSFPRDFEVAILPQHRNPYDFAARLLGARIVDLDATSPDTACLLWFAGAHYGDADLGKAIALAHSYGVPVLVDAAAQVPPISSLWSFTVDAGADAVILSGGKGLRGPQSSGLVLGRADIVEGCRRFGSPNHGVGRGMKVGKEELLGLLAAVEWSLAQDEPALLDSYERVVTDWLTALNRFPGVTAVRGFPSEAGQPHSRALVRVAGWSAPALADALWSGSPRVAVLVVDDAIALNPQTLAPGEHSLVLDALVAVVASSRFEPI